MSNPKLVLKELRHRIRPGAAGAVLLFGPSFSGKTWILENLATSAGEDRHLLYVLERCASGLIGFEPVLSAIEVAARRENWSRPKWVHSLAVQGGKVAALVTGGLMRRLFPDAIPDEVLGQLREALGTSAAPVSERGVTLEFPRSEVSRLVALLRKSIAACGRTLVLAIDRIDELPTPGIKLLQHLGEVQIANFTLVLSANSESLAFVQRPDIRELTNVYRRQGGAVFEVEGYSPEELRELRWLNGQATSEAGGRAAFEYSLGGRIGLLSAWLNSEDERLDPLRTDADRLVAHFAVQFDLLPSPAQELVKCLGAVYPGGLTLDQVSACLGCEQNSLDRELRGVLNLFASIAGREVLLRNRHVLYFLRSRVAPAFVEASYKALELKLETEAVVPAHTTLSHSGSAAQKPRLPAPTTTMNPQTLLATTREDLRRGASTAALARIEAWRSWNVEADLDAALLTEVLLAEADALGQLGEYDGAISCLNRAPGGPHASIDVDISLGEKYLRAGSPMKALVYLRHARSAARRTKRPELWVNATSRTLTILKDGRRGVPSGRLASLLASLCLDQAHQVLDPHVRCLGLRTAARTFALIPGRDEEARRLAAEALSIALSNADWLRDAGNCHYAVGDVSRHQGLYADSLEAFGRALSIADKTSNYDLRIYSYLGIVASQLASTDAGGALESLEALRGTLSAVESDESTIADLFQAVAMRLLLRPVRGLPDVSRLSHRPWAASLRRALEGDGRDFAGEVGRIRIVL